MADYLQHHGILGQKWGVRRYQNYDGTYTKRGLQRYNKSRENYNEVKDKYNRGQASRSDVRAARKQMNKSYDQLRKDNLADQGKEIYKSGRTIGSNDAKTAAAYTVSSVGAFAATSLYKYGDKIFSDNKARKIATYSAATISAGAAAAGTVLKLKGEYEAKRLRAYYSH